MLTVTNLYSLIYSVFKMYVCTSCSLCVHIHACVSLDTFLAVFKLTETLDFHKDFTGKNMCSRRCPVWLQSSPLFVQICIPGSWLVHLFLCKKFKSKQRERGKIMYNYKLYFTAIFRVSGLTVMTYRLLITAPCCLLGTSGDCEDSAWTRSWHTDQDLQRGKASRPGQEILQDRLCWLSHLCRWGVKAFSLAAFVLSRCS